MDRDESTVEERERYESPVVQDLGSLAELTQGEPGEPLIDQLGIGASV